jgi:transcriptional regulator with XRE-family HTH domain
MNNSTNPLKKAFKDKDYRHGYADEFLNSSIATQIKVLREQRGWSQKELGEHADNMMQPRISVMENVNYSSWSIKILRKIAEAFDLTLRVSFESFGTRVGDIEKFSRKNLERCSFDKDPYFLLEKEGMKNVSGGEQYMMFTKEAIFTVETAIKIDTQGTSGAGVDIEQDKDIPVMAASSFRYQNIPTDDFAEVA